MRRVALLLLMVCVASVAHAGLPETVARVKPAVVAVGTYLPTRAPAFRFSGTGFAVGDGSLVATNAHVVRAPLDSEALERWAIGIPRAGGGLEVRVVSVAASDPAHDLVVLKHGGAPLPPLFLRDEAVALREGEELSFTGYPIGAVLGFFAVTHRALVSAVSPIAIARPSARSLESRDVRLLDNAPWPVIQLDATAYPGSSGSPLFDPRNGEVVGIVNMVFVKGSRESALSQPSGITFAIPSRYLSDLLRGLGGAGF